MSTYGQSNQTNKSPILDECADILNEIRDVGNNRARLTGLQKRCLDDPDSSGESESQRDVDLLTQQIMDQYRRLADRIREVRRNPESRQQLNIPQVGLAERRLKNEVQQFQKQESEFRKESKTQMARQIRIVRPDLTEDEVQDALKDGEGGQVFQDALMRNRLGQANQVLGAVKERHNAMLKIEDDLKNLMNLLEHMHELLAKQEVTVMAIDTNAEQAAGDMVKANEELEVAVTTARKTRKKKWICLGICGMSSPKKSRPSLAPELTCDSSYHCRYYCRGRGCLYHGQPCCERRR
jgi:syntaxin 1B/2/3